MTTAKRSRLAATKPDYQSGIYHKKAKFDGDMLPSELLLAIFRYLPAKAVPKARTVCRRWNHLIVANADKLPKICIVEICITGLDDKELFVVFDGGNRSIEVSFEWLLNARSKKRPNLQTLLRHIVVTSCFSFVRCNTLTSAIFDELCECGSSFGDDAGVGMFDVDLRKITTKSFIRFLSSANSLFHFLHINLVCVQQTFLADSALAAITGGKLQRIRCAGYTIDEKMNNVYDMKYVTRETLRHFAHLPAPLVDIALSQSSRIRPSDVIEFIQTWQLSVNAHKLTCLTLNCSSSVNYTSIEALLLKSTFETQYLPRDNKFLIKHSVLRDHILEICLPAWRQWFI